MLDKSGRSGIIRIRNNDKSYTVYYREFLFGITYHVFQSDTRSLNFDAKEAEKKMNSDSDKTIAIPIDEQGIIDYDNDVSKEDHLKYFTLPATEFNILWNCGFFNKLNSELGLMIDDYEEEIIPNCDLEITERIFNEYTKGHKCPNFAAAIKFAKECDTQIGLEF